jgi:peptide/nickel transport system substrate-binding protein
MVRSRIARKPLMASLIGGLGMGLFLAAAIAASGTRAAASGAKDGGTLMIGDNTFNYIDPALAQPAGSSSNLAFAAWPAEDASCALLLRYEVGRSPSMRYKLVPEVAAAYPAVSHDGKMYTFTIRKGYRFSNGAPVTAANYAAEISRILSPIMHSPAATYLEEVIGADRVRQGSAQTASGVKVAGNRLTIQLTKRAADFPARMTMPYFCPVPVDLPPDPEGVDAPLPGSGPYYFAEFVRGNRIVLERNSHYRGPRPHHVDRMVISLGEASGTTVRRVEKAEEDVAMQVPIALVDEIRAKYGVNRQQYFSFPAPMVFSLVMNTSRPLFKHNVKLRQAVNFALDRPRLRDVVGRSTGPVTADYLPPIMPGYVKGGRYPLKQPDLNKARALAKGHTRSGKAVMYVCDTQGFGCPAQAAIVTENLARIGIDVEVRYFPLDIAVAKTGTRSEPFDLTLSRLDALYLDPTQFVNRMFDGRTIRKDGNLNRSYFDSGRYNQLIEQAGKLPGNARFDAYGKLAVDIARDAAPAAAFSVRNWRFFVASHVGCVRPAAQGGLDLAALCLN